MIPIKLYIPTSTLNFNNIMSSESISPVKFYLERGFGYKRFEKVLPNNLDYSIILYDKYPQFTINDKEMENYPMVIEIETKSANEDVIRKYQDGIYLSEETIYLNPFTTKIIFRNEQEKRSTLSKAEPSIETKMIPLYDKCKCFYIKNGNIESFDWLGNSEIQDTSTDYLHYISKDKKINKLKGFLYAYILAANRSLPKAIVSLKKYAKELRNTLSAVIASPDGIPTYQQREQLKYLYENIDIAFQKADDSFIKFEAIIEEKKEIYKTDILGIFKKEGVYEFWQNKTYKENNLLPSFHIQEFRIYSADDKEKSFVNYISRLEDQISNLENKHENMKIQIENFPIISNGKIEQIHGQNEFVSKLLGEYLAEAYNSTDFIQSRYEFAKAGGKLFKEELKNKWKETDYNNGIDYLNGLLKKLNEYTSFDIKSYSSHTLQSLAAFCQKGDSDIENLEDYLISNEIGDFRIAFSLWGIVFGFVDMPKTLTNNLFSSNDTNYIGETYKYIFKQVHNIDIEGNFDVKHPIAKETSVTIPLKMNIETHDVKQQPANNIGEELNGKLIQELCMFEEYNSRDDKTKEEIINKLREVEILTLTEWNDNKVNKIQWTTRKGQMRLMSAITKSKRNNRILFQIESTKNFLNDFDFLSTNKNFIAIVSKNKDWEKDLKWFIDEYNNSDSEYYKDKPKDNKTVIKKFIFLKNGRYKESEEFLKQLYL